MRNESSPKGIYSFFIGVVGLSYMFAIWRALNSDTFANGNKYLLVTLVLVFGTIYWQSRQIEKFTQRSFKDILYSKDVEKPKKWALIFSISVGVAVFTAILFAQFVVWFSDAGWLRDTVTSLALKYTGLVPDSDIAPIPWLIMGLIFLFVFSCIIAASVFMALFMGTTFTCLSVIIALHNWFNGGSFDIGILLEAFFDFSLSNTFSYLFVIVQFVISQIITSGNSSG